MPSGEQRSTQTGTAPWPAKEDLAGQKHINELNRQIGDYLASEPFQLRIRQCRYPPERLVYVEAKRPLPDEIPLIVGDAVHNLRSALDHLCWAMVGHKAPNPKQVGFPFVEHSDRLTSAIATRQMHLAPKYVTDGIHALKPYPSGDKYLHAVKAMDERDKHHVILLMGQGAEFNLADLQALIGRENIIGFPKGTVATVASVGDFVVKLNLSEPIEEFDREADRQQSAPMDRQIASSGKTSSSKALVALVQSACPVRSCPGRNGLDQLGRFQTTPDLRMGSRVSRGRRGDTFGGGFCYHDREDEHSSEWIAVEAITQQMFLFCS